MRTRISFQHILLAFFGFIALMLVVRIYYSGRFHYLFLVWNIFLAWIPFAVSSLFTRIDAKHKWIQALVCCCWLAFFPNALYIVTDLVHLDLESTIPKWFDALLLFSSSVVGLLLAFISLQRAEQYLQRKVPVKMVPPLILLILFLGSFGVYLGRFLRWNSWDIIGDPLGLLSSIGHRVIYPADHWHTWGVTGMFTLFFYLLYIAIKKMPGYLAGHSVNKYVH